MASKTEKPTLKYLKRPSNPHYDFCFNPTDILGTGAYGRVYKGQDRHGNPVAIKKIDFHYKTDGYSFEAIKTETNIIKYLKDDNIIKFLDSYQSKTGVYIVQEFANGGNLHDFLQNRKKVKEESAIKYITQIVGGLGYLVKNGIAHRDLKPMNILIVEGRLKLADFGLSRFIGISQKMISKVGTSLYMPPQILSHNQYTIKCDIWSLGVICYQMVAGKIPWSTEKKSILEYLKQIQLFVKNGCPFPPDCQISDQLKGFITGCLEYEQNKRFGWIEVFLHKIFKGKFKKAVALDENFSTKFCFSTLRQSIHLQNLDLESLLEQMPDVLDFQTFKFIVQAIESTLSPSQVLQMYKKVQSARGVEKTDLILILKKNKVNLKGHKFDELYSLTQKKNIVSTLQQLFIRIQSMKLDLFDLFKSKITNDSLLLEPEMFKQMIIAVDPSISPLHLPELLQYFDINRDGKVSYVQIYTQFCKIAQMIVIKDKNMMDSFRRMRSKKQKPSDIVKSCT